MIVQIPKDIEQKDTLICVLCGKPVSLENGTIGPTSVEGRVAIFCNGHLWDGPKLIVMLADYLAEQRRKFLRGHVSNIGNQGGEARDAWLIY